VLKTGHYRGGLTWAGAFLLVLASNGVFGKGPTDCTGSVGKLGSAGNLLERLDSVKVIRCDEVQWRFLGLSLATR